MTPNDFLVGCLVVVAALMFYEAATKPYLYNKQRHTPATVQAAAIRGYSRTAQVVCCIAAGMLVFAALLHWFV
jgi:hypothetical protein